jgi:hypothetical protein
MSDPRYSDPRYQPPPFQDSDRARQLGQMESTNAMWGWIAGGVVVVLMLLFVFGRNPNATSDSASVSSPPATTTGQATPRAPASPPAALRPAPPATTGQGTPPR